MSSAPPVEGRPGPDGAGGPLRLALLGLVLITSVGLSLELVLLEHFESVWQWIPFVALGAAVGSGVVVLLRPGPRTLGVFQGVMALCLAMGLLGLYLHYHGNLEFELEMDADLAGLDLAWRALHGATPTLAPAALAQLGLLGLLYTFRHPALGRRAHSRRGEEST